MLQIRQPLLLLLLGALLLSANDPLLAKPGNKKGKGQVGKHLEHPTVVQPVQYEYDYFSHLGVYYNRTTRTYYWIEDGQWRHDRKPPSHLPLAGQATRIRMGGETPYDYHRINEERLPYLQGKKNFGQRRGPPDHAPAWGYRKKQGYLYYPDQRVYYVPETKNYLWLERGKIKVGLELPNWIKVDPYRGVTVELDRDLQIEDFKKIFK